MAKGPADAGRNSLPQSFRCAAAGLVYALRHERNLRIDFSVGALVLYFSRYYGFNKAEMALLIFMAGFVVVCELINTAIERTVDLETSSYRSLARAAKDVAAGAVLVSAICSVVAGWLLLWDPDVIAAIWTDMRSRFYLWIPVALLLLLWIFLPQPKRQDDE